MFSCLRPSYSFPKQLFISSRNCFSVLSPISDKLSNNYDTNKITFEKSYKPKQIQRRYLSLQNINNLYDSLYTSEATKLATSILIEMHDIMNFPWSVTILAASVLMKSFIGFPCAVYQRYLVARLEEIHLELKEQTPKLQKEILNKAVRGQWTKEKLQKEFKKEVVQQWKGLVVKNNCHPFKITILFFIQFPFWLFLSFAIKTLVLDNHFKNDNYFFKLPKLDSSTDSFINLFGFSVHLVDTLQFQTDGPFWSPNLLLPDPTYILPALNCLSMLMTIEISAFSKTTKNVTSSWVKKLISNFMRLFAVVFFFISAVSPSALSLFWTSSSLFALSQSILLLSPRTRRLFRIPRVPSEIDKPYTVAFNKLVEKLSKVFFWKKT